MKTSDFNYDLPQELIAQTPLDRRDGSRLMTLDKTTGEIGHHHFYDLPQFLRPGDCLVLNDSRVLPARLIGHRPTGGAVEILLLVDKEATCGSVLCARAKSCARVPVLLLEKVSFRRRCRRFCPMATGWYILSTKASFLRFWRSWAGCRFRLISRPN